MIGLYGQFLSGIQSGSDYDTHNLSIKTASPKQRPAAATKQYASDDAMGFMQQYLSSMQPKRHYAADQGTPLPRSRINEYSYGGARGQQTGRAGAGRHRLQL
jgi:hypothetical protein